MARRGTSSDLVDQIHHLAKVRVAGSNPVFRSNVMSQDVDCDRLQRGTGLSQMIGLASIA